MWFFPPGFPHSLQAKNTTADGAEFLLVFDNGAFSEDSTFLLTVITLFFSFMMVQTNGWSGLVGACSKGSYRQELPDRYISLRPYPEQTVIYFPLYALVHTCYQEFF